VRLAPERHFLALTMHHTVSDGWSTGILLAEVAALYTAFAADPPGARPSPLPELPIQYADFAAWQRAWLSGEVLETQVAYWRQELSGASILELPADRPRPAIQRFRGDTTLPFAIPPATAAALRAVSRRQRTTLFMSLVATYGALLARTAGQPDVAVGTPIAGRDRVEVEPLIGFFTNTLVIRVRLDADPTVAELLARVREASLGASAHQDLPFEKLVEVLKPDRDMSRNPIFQVMFVLQNLAQNG